ncbi:LysR family transcriptional regulator [Aureimonas sp. SA4125]|uniref:LysR family transcriptional regulator n=1 Tax=Aureimonas sp. SA4125 TaxID=2826993 RepID=UPI001CC5C617|nr:LysR family transcriptional regulator [Aureimonas sp. SA4125]BDA87088.1 LysR family transcriptional regulator [Aureimonas sp. SA4125]
MPIARHAVTLDSELLRTFLAINDAGNFTKAGEAVGRTQSAVSLQVKRLEGLVGAPLFTRGPRGVVGTAAAEYLLPNARRIIALLDETSAAMRSRPLNGPVRIGMPEEYSHTILPQALGAFAKRHPLVEVTVSYASSAANRQAVAAEGLELAVVFEEAGTGSAEWLATDPTVWVTSTVHCVHEQDPVPVALNATQGWCRAVALNSLDRAGIRFRAAYTADTCSPLQAAVTSGLAIAPLCRSQIPPKCRELTEGDGFGIVDSSSVGLLRNSMATGAVVDGMAEAIRGAFAQRTFE